MPDRRQGDRRESSQGIASKKIEISLGTFIFIVLFVLTVIILSITSVVVAKIFYNKGYSQAIIDLEASNEYYDTTYETSLNDTVSNSLTN